MRKSLVPWVLPAALVLGVVGGAAASAIGVAGVTVLYFLLLLVFLGFLVRLRLRYLKENPPDPELTHKPFWRF